MFLSKFSKTLRVKHKNSSNNHPLTLNLNITVNVNPQRKTGVAELRYEFISRRGAPGAEKKIHIQIQQRRKTSPRTSALTSAYLCVEKIFTKKVFLPDN
jgi:hypothetical protein